jgi:hypothetical protein
VIDFISGQDTVHAGLSQSCDLGVEANRFALDRIFMNQITRYLTAFALFVALTPLQESFSADSEHADIKTEITKRHDEAVKRLQDWIGQVSIAAENRGYPEGAEYMAKLARDAGFQQATVINTDGKPGVFATLDAGAPKTVGLYFMYDVKQFDPAEWTSPPTEARIVDKPPNRALEPR